MIILTTRLIVGRRAYIIASLKRFYCKPQQLPLGLWPGVRGFHGGDQVFCP